MVRHKCLRLLGFFFTLTYIIIYVIITRAHSNKINIKKPPMTENNEKNEEPYFPDFKNDGPPDRFEKTLLRIGYDRIILIHVFILAIAAFAIFYHN
ncbi:MAG: hypothetical protein NTX66_03170 [Candidatus Falkowbacteria bacterium]|nr:hypothetical protein [Candidatus Falkowbacteria bacterium]